MARTDRTHLVCRFALQWVVLSDAGGNVTKLAAMLDQRRITQAELSRRSGVSRPAIIRACRGEDVALDTWVRLARALGVNVYDISTEAYGRLVGTV
jgi:transcriptional regulator with XRE-family HTH domain